MVAPSHEKLSESYSLGSSELILIYKTSLTYFDCSNYSNVYTIFTKLYLSLLYDVLPGSSNKLYST